ncbi:ABC-type multidrug transport system ATPase subunit [Kineosporia succinea]|uniref:ABC-type multidrug transport system ATPase subunit n=2 Tax=Kineosporia succinea TaxID=84632 RepID=A0ABT9PEF4_9ACTN|nr:ABC transporter ATP-binding protein [Kineosporia succinea]MDP9831103.1 ABC-type multidrug transport system ATPase subunit [Kineosporia succinea]
MTKGLPRMRTLSSAETAPTRYAWTVEASDLKVRAGRTLAVDGLTLRLGTGVHGLLGPNGAGKTTLIRALATVLPVTGGDLTLLGHDAARGSHLRDIRRELGYLPQQFGFYPKFTVREFVEYMAWLKEMPDREIPAAAQRAIERVGLADQAGQKMKALSGGMLRRAGIAQAVVHDPRFLLLDEPTVGLDPAQRVGFRTLLRELGHDACLLVSTHLVEDVSAACHNVVLMASGQKVWEGTPDELAAAGQDSDPGDSPTERGYSALLGRAGGWN